VYLYGGKNESTSMEKDLKLFTQILEQKTANNDYIQYHLSIHPTAKHNEADWGAEFPQAIKWLFFDQN
jgi:hypothetical protein